MLCTTIPRFANTQPVPVDEVPLLAVSEFRQTIIDEVRKGKRLSALFGQPATEGVRLWCVLAHDEMGCLQLLSSVVDDQYEALTPQCPQAHWFEREIAEQWGVRPVGHPWFKPIRFHRSYRKGRDAWGRGERDQILPCVTDFFQVTGSEIHEVAVGPIHAGVIEPGHFRFQCHGEKVFHLEISLGYQHRGVEQALVGGPHKRTLHYMETLAGDTTIGHATAYCQALEALAGIEPPVRAQIIRGVALELERLANHTGDMGALAQDVGFLPTSAYCGRLRGDYLNATALICGNRFGRGLMRVGGVGFDLDLDRCKQLRERVGVSLEEVEGATSLLWDSPSVTARFEETGAVSAKACADVGLVGPAARACGVDLDVRHDFPSGIYRFAQIPVSSCDSGDVFARAYVRWQEIRRSSEFIASELHALPDGAARTPIGSLAPNSVVVSLVEGWRGEICHVAITDEGGHFAAYKIVDPSFHNWFGLALALRGQQISDFPLCNKSFNLSYCGHDL